MAMVAAAGRVSGITTYVYPGDSLTNGFGGTSYITRLRGLSGMGGRHVAQALNGQTAAAIDASYVTQMQSLRPDAVYSPTGWVLPWLGTNDLGGGATDTAVLASLQSIWDKAIADGFSAGRFTILPRADAAWLANPSFETRRLALNASIRSNSTAGTRLFDVAAISQLSDPNNATYYNADKLHLTQDGYDLVADFVQSQLGGNIKASLTGGPTRSLLTKGRLVA
jgi:lysophospholipase L1-like esterase